MNPNGITNLSFKDLPKVQKRHPKVWNEPRNLTVLKGLAMQSASYEDLARRLGIAERTLYLWRAQYPAIDEAINMGRADADAAVLTYTFERLLTGDERAIDYWWRYRLNPSRATGSNRRAAAQPPAKVFNTTE